MKKAQMLIYKPNSLSYWLIVLSLASSTFTDVMILRSIEYNSKVLYFVLGAILTSLLLFLLAVKIKLYSVKWAKAGMVFGVLQFARIFLLPSNIGIVYVVLMLVAVTLTFAGCIFSIKRTTSRNNYIIKNNINQTEL